MPTINHPLDPCPVGPDTLRHLDAAEKRAEKYDAAYTLLHDDFVRTLCDDPAGRIDVPYSGSHGTGTSRVRMSELVRDLLDDDKHGALRFADLLNVLALSYAGHADLAHTAARTLMTELASAYATDCVDAQVANMSNPD
jgi:hypothetical protein